LKAVSDAPTSENDGVHEGVDTLLDVDDDVWDVDDETLEDEVDWIEELELVVKDFVVEEVVVSPLDILPLDVLLLVLLLDVARDPELLFKVELNLEDVDVPLDFIEERDFTLDVVLTEEDVTVVVGACIWVVTPSKHEQPLEMRVVEHAFKYDGRGGWTVLYSHEEAVRKEAGRMYLQSDCKVFRTERDSNFTAT
jgi:hypothetical protein